VCAHLSRSARKTKFAWYCHGVEHWVNSTAEVRAAHAAKQAEAEEAVRREERKLELEEDTVIEGAESDSFAYTGQLRYLLPTDAACSPRRRARWETCASQAMCPRPRARVHAGG